MKAPGSSNTNLVLTLYVAGRSPNSLRALANLAAMARDYLPAHQLEVVDVLATPERALADGILATPTLIRHAPLPRLRVIGDLSATGQVLLTLGIDQTVK